MFPSVITTIADPQASDRLNNPSHSTIHRDENAAIEQIETFIGTTTSSTLGTILYDVRSPDSDGGGHVQTANKGGTGQTMYNKGDILIASSSSVLTKLAAASTAGYVLTVAPSAPTGVQWSPGTASTKIDIKNTNLARFAGEASIFVTYYSGSVLGSTLGTSNGIRFSMNFPQMYLGGSGTSVLGRIVYGNNVAAQFFLPNAQASVRGEMNVQGVIAAASSVTAQAITLTGSINPPNQWLNNTGITPQNITIFATGTSSVNSSADQTLQFQVLVTGGQNDTSVSSGMAVVEKIA